LQAAAQRWDYDAAKLLIDNGADVNTVGSAEGYELAASNLDENLIFDSLLRIVRKTENLDRGCSSIRLKRATTGSAAKLKLERLLLGAGARDFTAEPEVSEPENVSIEPSSLGLSRGLL